MGQRVAKINQQTIAKILRDMTLIAGDDPSNRFLIGSQHLTKVFRIELARQRFPEVQFLTGRAPDDLGDLARQARLFTMMDVLEHVDDDRALFAELLAAATPGSYFLLTVPADMAL